MANPYKRNKQDMQNDEERLMTIEIALSNHEKMLDELNAVIIEQNKEIAGLYKHNQYLLKLIKEDTVKSLADETPPPHY